MDGRKRGRTHAADRRLPVREERRVQEVILRQAAPDHTGRGDAEAQVPGYGEDVSAVPQRAGVVLPHQLPVSTAAAAAVPINFRSA